MSETEHIDLLEEILWTGFSAALWCMASSFMVELSIVSTLREDTGCPGGERQNLGWKTDIKQQPQHPQKSSWQPLASVKKNRAELLETCNKAWCYLQKRGAQPGLLHLVSDRKKKSRQCFLTACEGRQTKIGGFPLFEEAARIEKAARGNQSTDVYDTEAEISFEFRRCPLVI